MTKLFIGGTQPLSLASLFYLGSGLGMMMLVVTGYLVRRGKPSREAPLSRSDIPYLAGMAIFGGVLAPITLMYSMILTPASTGALLLNFEPVATAVLAALFFHEAVGRRIWIAMLVITSSCLLLSLDTNGEIGMSVGALGILLACLFWGLDNNISRHVSGRDPFVSIMVKGCVAGIISLALTMVLGISLPSLGAIPLYLFVGFFSYGGLASIFFLLALRSLGSARTGLFLALSPFFGVFFSLLLFTEPQPPLFIIAFPIMIIGTWLLISEKHEHIHYHSPLVHNHRHRHDDGHHEHEHNSSCPMVSRSGDHTHLHAHVESTHTHPHKPDLHHRHDHPRS